MRTCRLSDNDLYCVAMKMRRSPELMQLLSAKSMIRYGPPKYTAGLARCFVSGYRRSPVPPARTMTRLSSRSSDTRGQLLRSTTLDGARSDTTITRATQNLQYEPGPP